MFDEILKQIPILYVVGLTISIIFGTFLIRRTVETAFPSLMKKGDENEPKQIYPNNLSRWWNKVILYLIPVLLGVIGALLLNDGGYDILKYRFGKIMFGMSIGWLSGTLWKLFKQWLYMKTGIAIPDIVDSGPGAVGENPPDPADQSDSK